MYEPLIQVYLTSDFHFFVTHFIILGIEITLSWCGYCIYELIEEICICFSG